MFSGLTQNLYYGNTAQDWLISLAFVVGSIIAARIFYFITTKGIKRLFEKLKKRFMYILTDMLEEPVAMLICVAGIYYAQRRLALPANVDLGADHVLTFIVILIITWTIARLLDDLITEYLVPIVEKSESKLDDQLLPILHKASGIVIWIIGIVVALDNAGYNVGTIVAGLGIGGLAFAFAAQETIANFFGGVTIFLDAPFVIDDRIKINGYEGWVREVGLRTAKIETLDGRRLTMPNAIFSKNVIENVSSEPATRVVETIGVACNQKVALVKKGLDILADVLKANPNLESNSSAWFKDFGDSSYNVCVVLWIKKGADYCKTISDTNCAIVEAFEKAGIEFSLPMRYLTGDKK
ncbi:MAG TPA: mechanosensitive ion channel family protein [Treponemataceae bacterium]|nr:mechanosensitive ion channel family protein [Treponemataceae bacterium]HPS43474.1 mechanosensitive ion channel family protein [Treponemataceae bacterium]